MTGKGFAICIENEARKVWEAASLISTMAHPMDEFFSP
jgi:hypothetical protein